MNNEKIGRRGFIKMLLAGTGAILVVGPQKIGEVLSEAASASKAGVGAERAPRWAMVIDQSRCIGCGDCTHACAAANNVAPNISWNQITETKPVNGQSVFLPVQCMQCENAPCVDVCPVKATYYRADGIVMMDYDRCIGCRYCQMACPYGARAFNWEAFKGDNPEVPTWGQPEVERRPRGVVEKCTFCYQRINRGLAHGLIPGVDRAATPKCVGVCPTGARIFGDLNDPDSPVSQALAVHSSFRLREELGTEPRIYYLPPQSNRSQDNRGEASA